MPKIRVTARHAEFRHGFVTVRPLEAPITTADVDCKNAEAVQDAGYALADWVRTNHPGVSFVVTWRALERKPNGTKFLRASLVEHNANA